MRDDGLQPRAAELVYALAAHAQLELEFADYAALDHAMYALTCVRVMSV
jgi:hypothetical protein